MPFKISMALVLRRTARTVKRCSDAPRQPRESRYPVTLRRIRAGGGVVDPAARTLDRYLLGTSGVLEVAARLEDDARFAPETFPELEIDLAQLSTIPF
jgi:hypothetical protein